MFEQLHAQETETERVTGRTIADRAYDFIEDNEIAILGFLLVFVAVFSLLRSHHKLLWYDEIFTVIVASQSNVHNFLAAMGPEGNPPLNTFLTHLVIGAFGTSQVVVRLVPLFGFLGALTGIYIFVRREAGKVLGILAVALTLFGPVWQYSYEARPYGILMGCFMLALVSWQEATRRNDRNPQQSRVLPLCGLALGILGCAFSHYIGLIEIGAPLLAGEAVRTYQRRRIDWRLWATGLCCLPCVVPISRMMHATGAFVMRETVLQPPLTADKLFAYLKFAAISWPLVMSDEILVLVLVVVLITWVPRTTSKPAISNRLSPPATVRSYVLWACVVASLLIPITWIALIFGHGWYFCRYGIGSALGIVLCLCLVLGKRRVRWPAFIVGVILAGGLKYLRDFQHELRITAAEPLPSNVLIQSQDSNLPIVISNPMTYPTAWWYSSPAQKPHVVFLRRPLGKSSDILSDLIMAEKPYFPAPMFEFKSFTLNTPHFLLEIDQPDLDGPFDVRPVLSNDGFVIRSFATTNGATLYDVNRISAR